MNEKTPESTELSVEQDRKKVAIAALTELLQEVASVRDIERAVTQLKQDQKVALQAAARKKPTPPAEFTVATLRTIGCKLHVSHNRLMNPDLPFAEIAEVYERAVDSDLAVSRTNYLKEFVVPWSKVVATRGGVTVVEITTPNGETVSGEAWCSKSDNYSRKDGVLYALGRAVVKLSDEAIAFSPVLIEAAAYWKVELADYLARLESDRAKYLESNPFASFMQSVQSWRAEGEPISGCGDHACPDCAPNDGEIGMIGHCEQ